MFVNGGGEDNTFPITTARHIGQLTFLTGLVGSFFVAGMCRSAHH